MNLQLVSLFAFALCANFMPEEDQDLSVQTGNVIVGPPGPRFIPLGPLKSNKELDRLRLLALNSDRPTKIPRRSNSNSYENK